MYIGDNINDLCSYHRDGHARTDIQIGMVAREGVEPTRLKALDLESSVSTGFHHRAKLVAEEGVEPTRTNVHKILSLERLPSFATRPLIKFRNSIWNQNKII